MTKEQRERLIYINGLLNGLTFVAENDKFAEALCDVLENIEVILKEDEQ